MPFSSYQSLALAKVNGWLPSHSGCREGAKKAILISSKIKGLPRRPTEGREMLLKILLSFHLP